MPVFKTQTRVGGVVVRSGSVCEVLLKFFCSVINFELVYFPMIYKKAPQKRGRLHQKSNYFLSTFYKYVCCKTAPPPFMPRARLFRYGRLFEFELFIMDSLFFLSLLILIKLN